MQKYGRTGKTIKKVEVFNNQRAENNADQILNVI